MNKILLILVGGTICTSLNKEGNLSVSDQAGVLLTSKFLQSDSLYAGRVSFDVTENLHLLSENMTIGNWNRILAVYGKYTGAKEYDGVVIAHGTDTLAYSAALLSMVLSDTNVPVMLVSANENLQSSTTNGNDNFRCAVECICHGITPNVYVPYRNISDGRMLLHLASRLRQCENYSEDFNSVGEVDITGLTETNYKRYFARLAAQFPPEKRKAWCNLSAQIELQNAVLLLNPYVGIDYDAYCYEKYKAVLHGTYHSGTACAEELSGEQNTAMAEELSGERNAAMTEKLSGERNSNRKSLMRQYGNESVLWMLDCCLGAERPVDVYFSPAQMKFGTYETVSFICNHEVKGRRAEFLYGTTNEMAYAKLVLAYSMFDTKEERKAFLSTEYNFELVTEGDGAGSVGSVGEIGENGEKSKNSEKNKNGEQGKSGKNKSREQGKKGLFVGLCTKDILFYAKDFPAHNQKDKTEDFATYIGGPATNAAITYAALGGDATLATCVGSSEESRRMVAELEGMGIHVLNFCEADVLPNTASIVVSPDGKRSVLSGQHPFTVDRDFDVDEYDFMLFDCNQQEISLDLLERAQASVVLDAGSFKSNIEKFLERADIIIASEDFRDNEGRDLLHMDCGATNKAITRGEKTILCPDGEVPVEPVEAVDTLGAGDIFHGAFCYGYFEKGMEFKEALRFASRIAGESVRYRGPKAWQEAYLK